MLDFTNLSRRQTRFCVNLVLKNPLFHLGRCNVDFGYSRWYNTSPTNTSNLFVVISMSSNRRAHRARLRSLECLAYSSLLSYLRMESSSDHSEHLIEQIRPLLNISSDRHRAELKRLLNDEDLQRLKALKTMEKEKEGGGGGEETNVQCTMKKKFK